MATNFLTFEHAFYTGDVASVLNAQLEEDDRVKQLRIRALLAEGKTPEALVRINQESEPVYAALRAFANKSVTEAEEIRAQGSLNDAALHIIALTYAAGGDTSKALEVLEQTSRSLDSSLLKTHILLSLNRLEDALRIVDETRQWANDHIVFNIAEALTSLQSPDGAQKAFFIYEENNSLHKSPISSLGEAVAQLELRRFPEAAEAISHAMTSESDAAIVSALALALIQGERSDAERLRSKLQLAKFTKSPFVADLKEKEDTFSRICAKFH